MYYAIFSLLKIFKKTISIVQIPALLILFIGLFEIESFSKTNQNKDHKKHFSKNQNQEKGVKKNLRKKEKFKNIEKDVTGSKEITVKEENIDLMKLYNDQKFLEITNIYEDSERSYLFNDDLTKLIAGSSYRMLNNMEKSIKILESIDAQNPNIRERVFFEIANAYFINKDLDNAEKYLNKIKTENKSLKENIDKMRGIISKAKSSLKLANMINLFKDKKYSEIVDIYEKNEDINMDPTFKIMISSSYRELNKDQESLKILETIKTNDYDSEIRILFDKIALYYKMSDRVKTLQYIDEFLAKINKNKSKLVDENTVEQIKNLKKNLESPNLNSPKNKPIYGSFEAGYMYDSNPNFSSGIKTGYLNLPIDNALVQDFGLTTSGNLGYNVNPTENVFIFGSIYSNYTRYNKTPGRDRVKVDALQGISYNYEKWTFSLSFMYDNLYFGRDQILHSAYFNMYSLSPSISYKFNEFLISKTSYQGTIKKFNTDISYRDSYINMISQSFYTKISKYNTIYFGGSFAIEKAKMSTYNDNMYSGFVTFRQYLPIAPVYFDISYYYTMLDFTNQNPVFNHIKRRDSYNSFSISTHYMPFQNLDLHIDYMFTKNTSSVSLYEFVRHQVIAGARFVF